MGLLISSFWHAAGDCLRPRVLWLSLLPLVLTVLLCIGLGYAWGGAAVALAGRGLDAFPLVGTALGWLQGAVGGDPRAVLAMLLVVVLALPALTIVSLLVVALAMTPALAGLVAARRFPRLERRQGAGVLQSLGWSLGSTGAALVALVVSLPLWFIPPLVLVLPPLIWGWLTYRVMAFDALAAHASVQERRTIFRRHRLPLLAIGIACGYLGAAPGIVWASGVLFAAAFVVLVPLAVWIYTLVFAFSSLWFLHYTLAALEQLRAGQGGTSITQNG